MNANNRAAKGTSKHRPGVQEQRRLIVDAAVTLFASRGSTATSVSEICKAAAVSRDTFYRCFADKKALISLLYERTVNTHILAVLDQAAMDFANPDWVSKVCNETIDAILGNADIAQFLYQESADPDTYAHQLINDAYNRSARRMQQWAEQEYGQAPPLAYFVSLLFATQWLLHTAISAGSDKAGISIAKQSIKQLFYGSFANIRNGEMPDWQ